MFTKQKISDKFCGLPKKIILYQYFFHENEELLGDFDRKQSRIATITFDSFSKVHMPRFAFVLHLTFLVCNGLLGLGKTNRLVVVIENSVVFSHEDISQNPLWARCRNIQGHECKQASA